MVLKAFQLFYNTILEEPVIHRQGNAHEEGGYESAYYAVNQSHLVHLNPFDQHPARIVVVLGGTAHAKKLVALWAS
jgi:hypothetical protein